VTRFFVFLSQGFASLAFRMEAPKAYQKECIPVKKLGICALSLFVLMALAPLTASADTFITNTTQVAPYQGSGTSNYYGVPWVGNIPTGDSLFKIYGYEIVTSSQTDNVYLNIYTNMPQGGDTDPRLPLALGPPLPVGNLFLNLGGNYYDYKNPADPTAGIIGFTQALVLPTSGSGGTLKTVTDVTTSKTLWSPYGSWIYGGEYRKSDTSASSGNVPVLATGSSDTTSGITASWSNNINTNPYYQANAGDYILSILFPGLDGNNGNDIVFLWASGTCANGVVFGTYDNPLSPPGVPVPPSALLLGSGLLGLALLRHRRKVR
jgi:hypothetical protein